MIKTFFMKNKYKYVDIRFLLPYPWFKAFEKSMRQSGYQKKTDFIKHLIRCDINQMKLEL